MALNKTRGDLGEMKKFFSRRVFKARLDGTQGSLIWCVAALPMVRVGTR